MSEVALEGLEGHRIYSCDDHLDIYHLPTELWEKRLPQKYREDGPRVVERGGGRVWVAAGQFMGLSGSYPGMATLRADVEEDGFRPSDPERRMQDMELDDIWASIVYGPGALWGFPLGDPELKKSVLRAWNDWAAEEFNSYSPDRLSALPVLPTTSPADAVEELQRCAGLGHRGALFHPQEVGLIDESWDPLWAAASEAGTPISFHIGGGSKLKAEPGSWQLPAFVSVVPMQLDEPFAVMMFSGALERHPGLKLVLAESGVGWVPYMVGRMDATFEKYCARDSNAALKTRPSEVFKRQVYATFEEEPFGPELIPVLGPDNFMWACDYPHPDSTWPESRKAIAHALGSLGPEAVRKVTGETCRRLYRLP